MKSLSFKSINYLVDILIFNLAFIVSYYLTFGLEKQIYSQRQFYLYILVSLFWLIGVLIVKPYSQDKTGFNISNLIWNLILVLFIHLSLICLYYVSTKDFSFSRLRLGYFYLLTFILSGLLRVVGVYLIRKLRKKGYFLRNYIIIGLGSKVQSIENFYLNHPEIGMNLKGKYKVDALFKESIMRTIIKSNIQIAYLMMSYISSANLEKAIQKLQSNEIKVKVLMDFTSFLEREVSIDYHDYLPVFNISSSLTLKLEEAFIKRFFDLFFSCIIMILGFPIFLLLIVLTKISSKGSVFYKSERIGYQGKKFNIYKFRSMVINADEIVHKLLGGDFHSQGSKDPRITNWGKFIRKTRLDELPQFWNVLKGEMSLVGPRPLPKYDVDMILEASEDKYHRLLMMKPGLTSLGQLRVGYATTERENVQRMNMDLLYHRKYSFWNDLWLVIQTTKLMVDGKGR